jgi:calcium/calmodulin-dependent protein kinase I
MARPNSVISVYHSDKGARTRESWRWERPNSILRPKYGRMATWFISSHDIWSLGILLWYLIFQRFPFKHTNNEYMLRQELLSFTPDFPENTEANLKDLFAKLLEPSPTERISIEEVLGHPWLSI